MEEISGKIEGKQVVRKGLAQIAEEGPGHFIVTSNEEIFEVFLTSSELLSDGNALDGIEVALKSEKERIFRDRFSAYQTGSIDAGNTKGMILKASMPGMVKAVSVKVEDIVEKSTQVLVLEAMKMENSITAGFSGVVSKIHVEPGMSVEKSMPLMEFRTGE